MNKVLKLKLFQQTACYRKPSSFKVGETYPLPPYSTVKGMLHKWMNANCLIPMEISIQGKYKSMIIDYSNRVFYKKKTDFLPLNINGQKIIYTDTINTNNSAFTHMPLPIHLLFDINLVIHVRANGNVIDSIIEGIETMGYCPTLGRNEDIVRIDSYEVVDIMPLPKSAANIMQYDAYVPQYIIDNLGADDLIYIPFNLNGRYEIKNNVREFEKILVGYVSKENSLEFYKGSIDIDSEGDCVFLQAI